MLTLTLDGQAVDLPADADVALSYRSSDLRRLDTREAAFSETFALPLTHRNARVLGHPHALTSQTGSPYRRLPAVLKANGVPVLRGAAVLEASAEGYEITLLDDTADLFGRVGEGKLRELDLSALDHPRTFAAVQAGSTDDPARGYVYALADTGRLAFAAADERVTATEVPASIYESYLLRALVARALPGFALTGTLLTDPLFARAVLPAVFSVPRLRERYLLPYRVQAGTAADARYFDSGTGSGGFLTVILPLVFPSLVLGDPAHFAGNSAYTPPAHAVQVQVQARLLIRNDGATKANVSVVRGSGVGSANIFFNQRFEPGFVGTVNLDLALPLYEAAAGPLYLCFANEFGGLNSTDITLLAGSSVTFAVAAPALTGAPVHMETGLPDLSQADYLQSLANRFNATFAVDAAAGTVRFDLFNELERRRAEAADWTRKLDYAARPRLDYRLPGFAQRNVFRYDDAPDAYAPVFGALSPEAAAAQVGTGALAVPDATLPPTADTYTAPFVLPLVHPVGGGAAEVAWLPTATGADPADPRYAVAWFFGGAFRKGDRVTSSGRTWTCLTDPYGNKAQPGDVTYAADWAGDALPDDEVPAVALLTALPATGPLLCDEQSTAAAPASFRPAWGLGTAGLSFAALLPAYHAGTQALLQRVQLLTVALALTPVDIAALDFSRPVRLNVRHVPGYGEIQGLFYLNLIDQYRPGVPGPVRVELLRLGDPIPGLAPAALPLALRPAHALFAETGQQLAQEPGIATNGPLLEEIQ